jgi:molecular chaperone DnaJ
MAKRDYYDVLGLGRGMDADALKKAYRKLAMQYHPDRNPGDGEAETRFKEVSEAYGVLKDDQKRAAYDRFGHAAFENGGAGPGRAGGFDFATGFSDIFDEVFGDYTGRRGNQAGAGRGADLRYNLDISLEDAFHGRKVEVRIPTSVECDDCDGKGAEGGAQPTTCPGCGGAGKVRSQQGFFMVERTCPGCGGFGQVIDDPCHACTGSGRVHREKTLSVNIPAGVDDGTRIRLAGEGEAGLRAAPAGDLYIFLRIEEHPLFIRDGADIYCVVPVAMVAAALGGAVEVPTIDGTRAKVEIPAGTQSAQRFRLRAKGMSIYQRKGRGDMYIEAVTETPVNLTAKQKELLRQFQEAGGGKSHSPQSDGFFAKVREFWEDLAE